MTSTRRIASLSAKQRQLLARKLAARGRSLPGLEKIPRAEERGVFPASFSQERLWFIDRLDPGSSTYVIPVAMALDGELDRGALAAAVAAVIERHEALRTTFALSSGEVQQIVHPVPAAAMPIVDLTRLDAPRRRAEAARLRRLVNRPFDLVRGPLLRAVLAVGEETAVFFCAVHHIVFDGWSSGLLLRELASFYEAEKSGAAARLPALEIQYGDYAAWQRQWLSGEVYEGQLAWWKDELHQARTVLELPFDRPRPAVQTFRGACRSRMLPEHLLAGLESLGAGGGEHRPATLFAVLLALFGVLLERLSHQDDLLVGTPVANRTHVEVRDLIGFFVNTLVLRLELADDDLADDPPFRTWLDSVQRRLVGAQEHQSFPFEKLVEELQPRRSLSHSPLFQVMFSLENTPPSGAKTGALALRALDDEHGVSHFDLSLFARKVRGGLRLVAEYNRDLFDATTVERWLRSFEILVAGAVAEPSRPLSALSARSAAEAHQLTLELNDTARGEAPFASLESWLAERTARAPEEVAAAFVEADGASVQLSRGELARRAALLAAELRALGVGPESLVGVLAEIGPRTLTAFLAVVQAGGAYLPLDPHYPEKRLAFMLEDAGAQVLLTEERWRERVPSFTGTSFAGRTLALEDEPAAELQPYRRRDEPEPSSLLYMIYTSGSTGRPKGVQISRGAFLSMLRTVAETPGMDAGDRLMALASLSFDIAGYELFLPLVTGARVAWVSREMARDGRRLARLLAERRTSVLQATPATWRLLFAAGWEGGTIKALSTAEALPQDLAGRLLAVCAEVWNLYGPTETTIWASFCRLGPDRVRQGVPIGHPLPEGALWLVDRRLRPVPQGAIGELLVGGPGLARGYARRPGLTAERFIANPFGGAGERLYRTGDLARRRPDGLVDLVGRVDHQVKIRGYRIDPGEVERVLGEHAAVVSAAVVARPASTGLGELELVAYAVLDATAELDRGELRAHLAASLPEHLVPSAIVELPELPVTANGKLDRAALPAPGAGDRGRGVSQIVPRTDTERQIAAVWGELLGLDKVGAEENFFELGGHSLLMVRVQERLGEVFGRELELVDLFRYPTVATLAGFLAPNVDEAPPQPGAARAARRRSASGEGAVAVVGMAGRFPGAASVDELWANLVAGREGISFFSDEELRQSGVPESAIADPSYVRAKGILDAAESFDAAFFGFQPREAMMLDPQHRVFLECAWEALENAGCDPWRFAGATGVFAGSSLNTYSYLLPRLGQTGFYQAMISNAKDYLPTRVSYKLNLRGPSIGVQTACSTSLVAVHMACQSLLNGECDLALAGGVSVIFPRHAGYFYTEGMIGSPDGHCRAFDHRAAGTVSGEGVGIVVLKPLGAALADGDNIRAVIRGSAVNNDGAQKVSFTAPSVEGQAEVIAEALAAAGVDASTIGHLEAHGTGTPMGDPIEAAALFQVYRAQTEKTGFCGLGSIKSNFGHLDAAAGIAGLIKTILSLEHRTLAPTLHVERPNPQIDFSKSPFFLATEARPWLAENGSPRRAGVSSFGIGGTNAHVIVEEAPPVNASSSKPSSDAEDRPSGPQLLVLSARTETALARAAERLGEHLAAHPELELEDVAHTLLSGRRRFAHRRFLVCRDAAEAATTLTQDPAGASTVGEEGTRPVMALLPGQGTQRPGMGQALYKGDERFKNRIDRAAEQLAPHLGLDLRQLLYPSPSEAEQAAEELRQTVFAQPALFVVEAALAEHYAAWGVRPRAFLGHSLGELTAAYLAGVFTFEDALQLVALRGRLMQSLPPGAMLEAAASPDQLLPHLAASIEVAAINAPARTVVSGPVEEILAVERRLREAGVAVKRLRSSHAFHSAMMEPIGDDFAAAVAAVDRRPPRVPFISNVSGTWIRPEEATDPCYWARQLRATVRFADGVRELAEEPSAVWLELGPGQALTGLAAQQGLGERVVTSLGNASTSETAILESLGRLWAAGVELAWPEDGKDRPRRVVLPSYPFERQRYCFEKKRRPPTGDVVSEPVSSSPPNPLSMAGEGEPDLLPPPSPVMERGAGGVRTSPALAMLYDVVSEVIGDGAERLDPRTSFLELGVDSLLLIQFTESLKKRCGVEIPIARLLEDLTTLEAVADHVAAFLPSAAAPAVPEAVDPVPPVASKPPVPTAAPPVVASAPSPSQSASKSSGELENPLQPTAPVAAGETLTPRQQEGLARLIERYTARTRESKRRTDSERPTFADNRAAVDFRLQMKELIYPIVGERSAGSRLWDVDGNEYVDLAMGFGVHFFGHSPPFILAALEEQLKKGLQLGPQSSLAGEVAAGIAELTGVERVTFTNTGTEAVMTAVRLARAVTGRHRIALFAGSYHGSFDGVLARSRGAGAADAVPLAPGVTPHLVEDVLVLPYGEPRALERLREVGPHLAAVLVEPVQSRRPDLQPRDFLHQLRGLTYAFGTALIFDEVITGFRTHPGGAQAHFGVRADLVTYGKVLGGGMPIGVVAGQAAFMDAIDGGTWRFGDASYPRANKTFFAGTFCKHPLAMAAAKAVLDHLRSRGSVLQEELNARTAALAERLNRFFVAEEVPIRVVHFGSLFRFAIDPRLRLGVLFFYYLLEHGIYTWEGRTCFLSTAHDDADLERLVAAVEASVADLRAAGFLPEGPAPRGEAAPPIPPPREEKASPSPPAVAPAPPTPKSAAPETITVSSITVPSTTVPSITVPSSPAQRQLWILAQVDDDASRAYNESKTLRLDGRLDIAALSRAWAHVVARHQALRAVFTADGQALRVGAGRRPGLALIDLSHLTSRDLEAEGDRLRAVAACRVFALDRGPLLDGQLIRCSDERHLLTLTCHHIVVDGRSLGVLIREIEAAYAAFSRGEEPRLDAPRSLAETQPMNAKGGEEDDRIGYWREQFEDGAPVLELPCDRPRPAVHGYRGDLRLLPLEGELLAASRSVGQHCGATLSMVLLGAFAALLHRLTGQDDVVVGLPSASAATGRPGLGYALTLLPIRSRAAAQTTFAELLSEHKTRVLGAQQHRDFSWTALLRELGLRPGGHRLPLAAAVFNLDQGRWYGLPFGDLKMTLETNATGGAKFELSLNVVDGGRRGLLEMVYGSDVLQATTVERWLRHYRMLLAAASADPSLPLTALPLLTPGENHQLLVEWNDGDAAALVPAVGVHELFEGQAARRPEAVAVSQDASSLSYGELDRRANRLAHHLLATGARRDERVAVSIERSPELVLTLLAVLKAGAAYLPLGADDPVERLAFMADDAGAEIVISRRGRLDQDLLAPRRAVLLDQHQAKIAKRPASSPGVKAYPDQLAYVIYTSGSTGRPKGVMVPHRGLVNRLLWARESYPIELDDRVLCKASFSFDFFFWECFGTLVSGARVVLAQAGARRDTASLRREIVFQRVTMAHFIPALLRVFLAEDDLAACRSLRHVFAGGEALPGESRELFAARLGSWARLINQYGPTELSIDVTHHRTSPADGATVPIGRPMANVRAFVLDRRGRPVVLGAAGELVVGGVAVSRGYLARPRLTAERFVPDPFGSVPGRLYHTGDLVRQRGDGVYEFLGRIDHQVKIRGFRVELGEIEAALESHPAVRQAVAVLSADGAGAPHLVAFVTGTPELDDELGEELREHLAQRLPDFMLPAAIESVDAMPMTGSGKLDRAALARRGVAALAAERAAAQRHVAPRTADEALLAGVWREVLGLETVGVTDNFFALGGDSILAIQVISRALQLGLRLTPKQLFEDPTVAGLARVATLSSGETRSDEPVVGEVPLTPIQRRFFAGRPAHPEHYNQALLLEVKGGLDPTALRWAVAAVLTHHDMLRARFERDDMLGDGDTWQQSVPPPDVEAVSCLQIELSALDGDAATRALEHAAAALQGSFELARGPLLRVALFTFADRAQRLLLLAHHLVVDGVSWRILLEDLATAHRQIDQGQLLALPPKTTSFKRWSEALHQLADDPAFAERAAAWARLVEEAPEPLPRDSDAGRADVASARTVSVGLGSEETEELLYELPRVFHTRINDVLLSALAEAFAAWTSRRRLLVELEGHGREPFADELMVLRTVGWFTTTFPVLLDVEGAASAGEALRQVKDQLRALPDRGLGFGVARYLGGGESAEALRAAPRPEVLFNYLGQLDRAASTASVFRVAGESVGATRHPEQELSHLIEINARVLGGRLRIDVTYSAARFHEATITGLAEGYLGALRALLAEARAPRKTALHAEDFPLAPLGDKDFERLSAHLAGRVVEDLYALSPMQHGLLFHRLHAPQSEAYFQQLTCTLEGPIDTAAFVHAWQKVIDRHTLLRTAFLWQDLAEPVQVVLRQVTAPWVEEDWRDLAPSEASRRLGAFLAADRQRGFALDEAPLMRFALLRRGEARWIFVWSHHHLLLDGWSVGPLMRELFALYQARMAGRPEPVLARPHPYRDFIAWLAEQDRAEAERFWRRRLAGFSHPTPLPFARSAARGPGRGQDQVELTRLLSPSLTQALDALARRRRVTWNTVLQGAWAVLLGKYSGESDVVFGAVSSGRSIPLLGVEEMLGLFVNTLPVRIVTPGAAVWESWLGELQSELAEARQVEHVSLAEVQSWSEVPPGTPIFETLFALENFPVGKEASAEGEAGLPGSWSIGGSHFTERTEYPLTLMVVPGDGATLRLLYQRHRFASTAVARLLGHFAALLADLTTHPEKRLRDAVILTAAERHQLLLEQNDSARPYDRGKLLHEPFLEQARRRPEAVAALFEDHFLSYRELEIRAARLAAFLRARGVERGDLVAIYVPRSLEMVLPLLAILQAGGAYVPLSSSFPPARLQWILENLEIRCLITHSAWLEPLAEPFGERSALEDVICLDRPSPSSSQSLAAALDNKNLWVADEIEAAEQPTSSPSHPDDLAYIIFTSGSTGTPKGVMVRHRPVGNLIEWVNRVFAVGPDDRLLFVTSLNFDLSVYDVFGMLAAGGTVQVASQADLDEPRRLVELMRREPITFWDSAPAALQQLEPYFAELEPETDEPALRLVFLSGDWIPLPLQPAVCRAFPRAEVISLGGATEATVWSNVHRIAAIDPQWVSVPYGRPIQNARYHVLDARFVPAPMAVPGDLFIGGECLASGYAGQPALTAERFVPDPFGERPGARLYATGDRARYWSDGELEFLGRLDHQVKIRGFRIELGEIESTLIEHAAVRTAVVLAVGESLAERHLAAFVVPQDAEPPASSELEAHLSERLPSYMVPRSLLWVDEIPVTANGKVDRVALERLEKARESGLDPSSSGHVPPRDALELELVKLWEELFEKSFIGIRDAFFDLGGHSLLAVRLLARIRQRFGMDLPLATLFEGGTVEHLARLLRQEVAEPPFSPLVPINERSSVSINERVPPLLCIHPAFGSVLRYRNLARHLGPEQPVYALQPYGERPGQEPLTRVEDMAAAYLEAVRQAVPDGPYQLAGWSFGGHVAYEMAQQLLRAGEEVGLLAMLDTGVWLEEDEPDPVEHLDAYVAEHLPGALEEMRRLQELDDQLRFLMQEMKRHDQLPPDWGFVDIRRYFNLYMANVRAAHHYRPEPYPGVITLFRASKAQDPSMGWAGLALGGVEIHEISGRHATLLSEPHVYELSQRLRGCLSGASTDEKASPATVEEEDPGDV